MRLKLIFLSISVVYGLFITTHFCFGQEPDRNALKSYTGIWMGTIVREGESHKPSEILFWRIHKIDNKKCEIELTEFDRHFYSSEKILDPKKMIRKGGMDKGDLWIEFKSVAGKLFRINLKLISSNDLIYLRDKDSQVNHPYSFSLGKISDDTSTYIKPKGEIKVRITKRSGIL